MKKQETSIVREESKAVVYNLDEAATALRISRSSIKRLVAEEKLAVVRVGRRVLVPRAALETIARTGAK